MGVIRKTKKVEALRQMFAETDKAISVVTLVDTLKGSMNKSTVYRILERLEEDGIVHSFNDTDGLKWYASCKGCSEKEHSDAHPHFKCTHCGNMECLPVDVQIPTISEYAIESSEIILVGECADCRA
ncbi:transcriptional repressor [Muricauda oceani]|uniref:Transcriptional regulator n=1 Tax=Flagellimonas oceani TaxID=2698672 RepID=A0A6G7J8D3_9FLAO|nr:transcriptional repressor [Allomuricauda oceani]MBW8242939.1 transcriptional repressor [Allomuricauda oceani]QII46702.1 transcriptional regulator [Allomuricauda oceani]